MIFFMCETLNDLVSKLQRSRSALVIFRDPQIGIVLMRRMEGGIKSGVLRSPGSICFPFIMLFFLSFRIHSSFEDIQEWGWLAGVRTQQGIFVIVVILTTEGGGLGSGPWELYSPWHSLPRKLPLLLNLTCPIETKVLWEIQEGPLTGRKICSLADKVVLREFWAQFFVLSTIYFLVITSVHEGDCIHQSFGACISPVFWWRLYLVGQYFCVPAVFWRAVMMGSDSASVCHAESI